MFVGKYWWASGAYAGDRYEGDYKDGKMNGTGNKSPLTPYHPTTPPPSPIKCLLLLLLLLCVGGFLSLFCIRKENIY